MTSTFFMQRLTLFGKKPAKVAPRSELHVSLFCSWFEKVFGARSSESAFRRPPFQGSEFEYVFTSFLNKYERFQKHGPL
jgi:hypothetical protein